MREGLRQFLRGESFDLHKEEVNRQNRLAIRYFAAAGLPVGVANITAQMTVRGAAPTLGQHSVWLFGYFLFLFVLDRCVIPQSCRHATLLAYLLEAPVFIVTILLGTVWDPDHQAMTFLMFMLVMPIFILDRPLRAMGVLAGWNALFLTLCVLVKNPDTLEGDFSHTLEFLLLALAVTFVVQSIRFEVIEGFARTRYHLEHDPLTGLQNMQSLEGRVGVYLGRRLFVTVGDIDHLALINDFYGKERGDETIRLFADVLRHESSEGNAYRYGGDDVMCLFAETSEEEGLRHIEACRHDLSTRQQRVLHASLTYSFGYTVGTPVDDKELYNMIQLASIYAHQATSKGEGNTIGGPYSAHALREGVNKANLAGVATSREINQLTGLPSVPYFAARAEEVMHHTNLLQQKPVVVGFLNLRNFREFNDEFGYAQGDDLLRYCAKLLGDAFPHRHIAYISGSRFAVLCQLDEVDSALKAVNEALGTYKPGHPISFRAGFVEYRKDESAIYLLDKAKLAHDGMDEQDVKPYRLYDAKLDEQVRLRQHLVTHLDQAIEQGWIRVHYQPIVCTESGKMCSMEALSRWNDPIYGLLPPLQFIGVLEGERLIYKLSLHVVRKVLKDLQRMRTEGLPLVPVSINLSRSDFFACDLIEEISTLADDAGIEHNLLCFEITESAFASDQRFLKREIDRLRAAGFEVWMDDFGSEYSTLNLMQELNFDLVKIDMRFMENFSRGTRNATIVSSVLDMCHSLGLVTLVEGVETQEQHALLHEMGCDKLQGYLFSPPRPFADILSHARVEESLARR